jgi:hypothetical protein
MGFIQVLQQMAAEQTHLLQMGTVASEIYKKGVTPGARPATHMTAAASLHMEKQQQQQQQQQQQEPNLSHTQLTHDRIFQQGLLPTVGIGPSKLPVHLVENLPQYLPADLKDLVMSRRIGSTLSSEGPAEIRTSCACRHAVKCCPCCCQWCPCHDSSSSNGGCSGSSGGGSTVEGQHAVDGRLRGPVWLHGDAMACNLLLQLIRQKAAGDARDSRECGKETEDEEQQAASAIGATAAGAGALCASGVVEDPGSIGVPVSLGGSGASHGTADGRGGCCSNDGSQRCWVSGRTEVSLIDFSDAGAGHPLFDFVALFVSLFDFDVELLKASLLSYRRSLPLSRHSNSTAARNADQAVHNAMSGSSSSCCQQQQLTIKADSRQCSGAALSSSSSLSNSKLFLVCLLLHEDEVVYRFFSRHPKLCQLDSWHQVEQRLFGQMLRKVLSYL